jgi:hypothetical protein
LRHCNVCDRVIVEVYIGGLTHHWQANAKLKDFADVLLEGPAAAAAALGGTEMREWEARDRKAKAAMMLAVGEEYLDLVGDAATARGAWVALEEVDVGESKAQRRTIAAEWAGI